MLLKILSSTPITPNLPLPPGRFLIHNSEFNTASWILSALRYYTAALTFFLAQSSLLSLRMLRETINLFQKEVQLELRQKAALGGILLFIVSTIFVCYLSFGTLSTVSTWNALFWIIIVFAAFNAIGRSFQEENGGLQLYLYSIASPAAVILSKTFYNGLVMLILSALALVVYVLFLGQAPLAEANFTMLILGVLLGSVGISATLTLIAGIAAKTENNIGLMGILGFPVLLPLLLSIMKFSKNALDGLAWSVNLRFLGIILLLNAAIFVLSYLLFPYLWRE